MAVLTENLSPARPFFIVSGTLPLTSQSYVERQADRDLLMALREGEYCFVLNSRQMGKSSLSIRTMARLTEEGIRTIFLDLTKLGGATVTPEQWYTGLLSETGRALGLRKEMFAYWQDQREFSLVQRYFSALQDVALKQIETPLVLFIDEIDAVKSLPFSTDEFFGALRECYNRRVREPEFNRLAVVLVGSAMASDLIQDTRTSPFNIGRRIEIKDFALNETLLLTEGLHRPNADELIRRVYYWSNGHPFLTQAICAEIARDESLRTAMDVDRLVARMFFDAKERQRNINLADVSNRLLSSYLAPDQKEEHLAAILDLYGRLLKRARAVPDDETNRLVAVLKLAGITRSVNGRLEIRNRIYEEVFNREWLTIHMPDAERQRQRAAYTRGILRSVAVSAVVVAVMAVLLAANIRNARDARNYAARARNEAINAKRLETLAKKALQQRDSAFKRELQAHKEVLSQKALAVQKAKEAVHEAREASRQSKIAVEASRRATDAGKVALEKQERAEKAERDLYPAVMKQIQSLSSMNEYGRVRALLDQTQRQGGGTFEWNYWDQKCLALPVQIETNRPVYRAAFSPDGKRVLLWSSSTWRTEWANNISRTEWNAQTGKFIASLPDVLPSSEPYAVSHDGTRIATLQGATVTIRDKQARRPLFVLNGHKGRVLSVAFSPDGKSIATGSEDRTAIVWYADTGKPRLTLEGPRTSVSSVAFSPDSSRLVCGSYDFAARIWDITNRQEPALALSNTGPSLTFSPDSACIALGLYPNQVHIMDVKTRKSRLILQRQREASTVDFSPDGKRLALGGYDGKIDVYDLPMDRPRYTLSGHTREVESIAFSSDGKRLASVDLGGVLCVWDAQTQKKIAAFRAHADATRFVFFSLDGKRIFSGGDDGKITINDAETGKEVAKPFTDGSASVFAALSPDGKIIASTAAGCEVLLRDSRTYKVVGRLRGHKGDIRSLGFSPDGTRLATGSWDKSVILWDIVRQVEVMSIDGNGGQHDPRFDAIAVGCRFSPNGAHLAIVYMNTSGGNTIRVWSVRRPAGKDAPDDDKGLLKRVGRRGRRST